MPRAFHNQLRSKTAWRVPHRGGGDQHKQTERLLSVCHFTIEIIYELQRVFPTLT